jgi:hypothetical protein
MKRLSALRRRASVKIEALLVLADSADPPLYSSILSGFAFMEENATAADRAALMAALVRRLRSSLMDWSKSIDVLLVDLETLEQKIEAQDERTSPSVWRALKAEFLRALNQPL